jgi:hypothetical protein
MKTAAAWGMALAIWAASAAHLPAADLVVLTPQTWDEFVPSGKEVDCIYGDLVLRNDRLVAVVAKAVAGRNANMTVKNVGGCVIDLSVLTPQSDQLSAFYPGGKKMAWRAAEPPRDVRSEPVVRASFRTEPAQGQPNAALTYTLEQGKPYLLVETTFTNPSGEPLEVPLLDEMRADTTFEKSPSGKAPLFWAYDPWFGQAYGVVSEAGKLQSTSDAKSSSLHYAQQGKTTVTLQPGEKLRLVRRFFPGSNLLEVRALAAELAGIEQQAYSLDVRDTAGKPVGGAEVKVQRDGKSAGSGRTDGHGRLAFRLPAGAATAEVSSLGRGERKLELKPGEQAIELPVAGWAEARISSASGGPIPCKVQFIGIDGTPTPNFGPSSGEHAVQNVYYSHNGRFSQVLPPGKYDVIVSYGPEYDAIFTKIEIQPGKSTPLAAALNHTVKTGGWISADFHNHSSPSGDNTSSQYGRVLNLLCEHLEYAPCTEHNRISTYAPHLTRLGVPHLMGTSTGIELTGSPLPLNHQNAFPLIYKPRTQDGGGPTNDVDPEIQIARLALWDNRSEKLVQQNHPNIGQLFFDKNGDNRPDGGFAAGLPHMDVVEVHPLNTIFKPAVVKWKNSVQNNRIVNWLQLLNQGYRLPGVVNTDAHYNFHGSGFLRIYLHSPTDDPARVKTLDVVHAAEQGHVVMTSGPFMEVSAQEDGVPRATPAIPGDHLTSTSGKVLLHIRVQCPNWFDIDRVQVLVNGRMPAELNFTREGQGNRFGSGVVKFDQTIPVALKSDAHLIVAAAGENLSMGPVMGPDHGKDMPIAVSNPIYIDVDGGGFKHNGDTLGAPLPVASAKGR